MLRVYARSDSINSCPCQEKNEKKKQKKRKKEGMELWFLRCAKEKNQEDIFTSRPKTREKEQAASEHADPYLIGLFASICLS